jgi:hypothetical protein
MDINLASLYQNSVISSICKRHVIALVGLMIFFSTSNTQAQLPGPATLGVGLNAVTGNKGAVDTELLTDLIVEKQIELKKELIRRGVSKLLQNENYAIWEYGYNLTSVLLEGNNKDIITKKILEQSTSLFFVYRFAEYGLQIDSIQKLLLSRKELSSGDKVTLKMLPQERRNGYIDLVYDVLINNQEVTADFGLFVNRLPFGLPFYYNLSAYHTLGKRDSSEKIDMDEVKNILARRIKFYMKNYYLLTFINSNGGEENINNNVEQLFGNGKPKEAIRVLKKEINRDWESLNKSSKYNFDNLIVKRYENSIKTSGNNKEFNDLATQNKDLTEAHADSGRSFLQNILPMRIVSFKLEVQTLFNSKKPPGINIINNVSSMPKSPDLDLTELLTEMDKFSLRITNAPDKVFSQDLYYIQQKVKPLVAKLVLQYGLDMLYLDVIKSTEASIISILVDAMDQNLLSEYSYLELIEKENSRNIVKTIEKLSALDKPISYEEILIDLKSELNQFAFDSAKANEGLKALHSLLANIDLNLLTYVTQGSLSIDVEDIIIWMYDNYIDQVVARRYAPYFTIGLNYSNLKSFGLGNEEKAEQFAYASEKVGFRANIADFKHIKAKKLRSNTFDRNKKYLFGKNVLKNPEPIISNIHGIAYISGLLYTLIDASTNEEFDSPVVAIGLGVSFFNSLELNFSHVWPMDVKRSSSLPRFFQFSFDIKLFDYLSAAKKKQLALKANKNK